MKLPKQKRLSRINCWTRTCWYKIINKDRNQFIPGAVFLSKGVWEQETEDHPLALKGAYCRPGQITAMRVVFPKYSVACEDF